MSLTTNKKADGLWHSCQQHCLYSELNVCVLKLKIEKQLKRAKIRLSKLLWATLVGKDGKSAEKAKLGSHCHFRSFQITMVGKE